MCRCFSSRGLAIRLPISRCCVPSAKSWDRAPRCKSSRRRSFVSRSEKGGKNGRGSHQGIGRGDSSVGCEVKRLRVKAMEKTRLERIRQITDGSHCFAHACFWSIVIVTLASLPSGGWAAPKREGGKALEIYFVDVEGGQSTLFVTAQGESLLIDTGWPDSNGRDAERIMAAAKLAGIKQLDFVLLTHYHMDHAGDRKSV